MTTPSSPAPRGRAPANGHRQYDSNGNEWERKRDQDHAHAADPNGGRAPAAPGVRAGGGGGGHGRREGGYDDEAVLPDDVEDHHDDRAAGELNLGLYTLETASPPS